MYLRNLIVCFCIVIQYDHHYIQKEKNMTTTTQKVKRQQLNYQTEDENADDCPYLINSLGVVSLLSWTSVTSMYFVGQNEEKTSTKVSTVDTTL